MTRVLLLTSLDTDLVAQVKMAFGTTAEFAECPDEMT